MAYLFHQPSLVHLYLRSFSFASPKENEPKEKAKLKHAASRTCRGTPAFELAQRSVPIEVRVINLICVSILNEMSIKV